jgi:hypothetical protein
MRGAPITVRCDCGAVEHVPYGDTWTCPTCGRRWNTTQIPEADYWGIMREMRGYRLQVLVASVVVAAVFAVLFITVGTRFLPLALLVMGFWFLVYMPRWRKKVRQRARNLPRWELEPE